MTQEELATAAGIGRIILVRIENGEQSAEIRDPVGAGGALGRRVGDLVAGQAGT